MIDIGNRSLSSQMNELYDYCLEALNQTTDFNEGIFLYRIEKFLQFAPLSRNQTEARNFIQMMNLFLEKGGNPHQSFDEIEIGPNLFRQPTCFHVVYLYWKAADHRVFE